MNLHEEMERTENESIKQISLRTHEVSGPGSHIVLNPWNLCFLCSSCKMHFGF